MPPPAQMKEEIVDFQLPKSPEDGKAMVYVVRPAGQGGMIRFNVFVDDKEPESEMGYTRGGQFIYFNLEPGDHLILSKAENWAEINLTAKSGEISFIKQEPSMGFVMARNSLVSIEEYEGKYHVKKLQPGEIIKLDK